MAEVSERVRARVVRDFGDLADEVIAVLLTVPETLPLGAGQSAERMQAALVLPAHGDIAVFGRLVELAHSDWRGLLVAADLADADWPQRLGDALGPG